MQLATKVIVMNAKSSMSNLLKFTLVLSILFLSACSIEKEKPAKSGAEPPNKSRTGWSIYTQKIPRQENSGSINRGAMAIMLAPKSRAIGSNRNRFSHEESFTIFSAKW